jgi:signal transduction histidine kinase
MPGRNCCEPQRQAIQEGRAAPASLRAFSAWTNNLDEALRCAAEHAGAQGRMTVSFSVIGQTRDLHLLVRDEVYRISTEAICNARSHSRASRLDVELRYAQDLAVRVSDNGIGMESSGAGERESFRVAGNA